MGKTTVVAGLAAVLASFAASGGAQQAAPEQPPRSPSAFRVSVDLVQVDAIVIDRHGQHVPHLTVDDFEILQNGRRQAISTFTYVATGAEPAPAAAVGSAALTPPPAIAPDQIRRTMAIVVDDLALSFESIARVRQVLRRFIDHDMRPGDLVAILRTGAGMGTLQQFTTDRRLLHAAVDRVRWNMNARVSPFEAASEIDRKVSALETESFTAGTLGAVRYVVRGVSELPGRKSIVLMSDGFRLTDADTKYGRILDMLRGLIDAANRAGVVIYGIDARGLVGTGASAADGSDVSPNTLLESRRRELMETEAGLGSLALETGGLFIRNTNDIEGGFRRVLDDQRGYYLLGYVPQASTFSATNPKFHSVTVRVKRDDLRVRSRSGFLGRPENSSSAGTATSRMIAAVTSPFAGGDIRLRLSSFFAQLETRGPVMHSVMHVDPRDLTFSNDADGTRVAQVELLAMTFGENGQVADQHSRRYTVRLTPERYETALTSGFVYTMHVPVKRPGAYQLRIALRDVPSERIGSASHFVDVPDVKTGRLTLSGLLVQGHAATAQGAEAGEAANPDSTLVVRRFRQGSHASYVCHVYNATWRRSGGPHLESQIRLFRNGMEVFRSSPRTIETSAGSSELLAAGVLQLGTETPPGSYLLELTVTDRLAKRNGQATQTIDFEVVE